VQRIDVCLEDVLDRPLARVDADLIALENTGYLDSITSFTDVDKFVISTQRHRVWCLTVWNIVGCLLELDDLLVSKAGAVVDNLHRVGRLANSTRALCRFGDLATVNVDPDGMVAY
jgi:hypothetical protein